MALGQDDVKWCDLCDTPEEDEGREVYTVIGGDEPRTQDVVGHICEDCWQFFVSGGEEE